MNAIIEITMNYTGLGANPDGSVVKVCEADLEKIKLISQLVDEAQRKDTISGQLEISKEYDDFALYLNDEDGYYIEDDSYSYRMWRNGTLLNANKIKLVEIDKEAKTLAFKLYDNCVNEYSILNTGSKAEINVKGDFPVNTTPLDYADFRTTNTKTTTESNVVADVTDLQEYIDTKMADKDWCVEDFEFTMVVSNTYGFTFDAKIYWIQYEAKGYNDGSRNYPPPGEEWQYDRMESGFPMYTKKPKWSIVNQATFVNPYYRVLITYEAISDISYAGNKILYSDLIETLVDNIDSNIIFDSNSFSKVNAITGASYSGSTSLFEKCFFMPMSDFIPATDGDQKNVDSSIAYMSFDRIMRYFKQYDFYWYLEEIAGDYYFRMEHTSSNSFAEGTNPSLNEYTYKTRKIKFNESNFDVITNSGTGQRYEAQYPQFVYRITDGDKAKIIQDEDIYSDIDMVIDSKQRAFNVLSGKQWIMTLTGEGGSEYNIRKFTSDITSVPAVHNIEMLFAYWTKYRSQVPGKKNVDDTEYTDERVEWRKEVKFQISLDDNPQTYFNFHEAVIWNNKETRIKRLEMGLLDTVAEITLNYL